MEPATQRQLDRGARMVELLKQPQYVPMDVIDQVMVIYAGAQGCLDQVPLDQVAAWEKDFLEYMSTAGSDVRSELAAKRDLTADIEAKLVESIKKFSSTTQVGKKGAAQYNVGHDTEKVLKDQVNTAKQPAAH